MTYQQIREVIVEEEKVMTPKKFRFFVLNLSLFFLFLGIDLSMALMAVMGMMWVLVTILVLVVAYSTTLQLCCESPTKIKVISILSKLWILWAVAMVAEYLVLSYFQFL